MTKRERKFGIQGLASDETLTMAERGAYELESFLQPRREKNKKKNKKNKAPKWLDD